MAQAKVTERWFALDEEQAGIIYGFMASARFTDTVEFVVDTEGHLGVNLTGSVVDGAYLTLDLFDWGVETGMTFRLPFGAARDALSYGEARWAVAGKWADTVDVTLFSSGAVRSVPIVKNASEHPFAGPKKGTTYHITEAVWSNALAPFMDYYLTRVKTLALIKGNFYGYANPSLIVRSNVAVDLPDIVFSNPDLLREFAVHARGAVDVTVGTYHVTLKAEGAMVYMSLGKAGPMSLPMASAILKNRLSGELLTSLKYADVRSTVLRAGSALVALRTEGGALTLATHDEAVSAPLTHATEAFDVRLPRDNIVAATDHLAVLDGHDTEFAVRFTRDTQTVLLSTDTVDVQLTTYH